VNLKEKYCFMDNNISTEAFTPGSAYWNQRLAIEKSKDRLLALSRTVGRSTDMHEYQLAQLFAASMEFQPDLILELGRGFGNSTCAFTEAANQLSGKSNTRVISLCNSNSWDMLTKKTISKIVPSAWFNPLQTLITDIITFNYEPILKDARRVLLFWDAHGFDIAECVFSNILPQLANRQHIVLMHDLSDTRYGADSQTDYGEQGLWNGENAGRGRFRIGIVDSAVAQAISALDFTNRNHLTLDSADHSFDLELVQKGRVEEMQSLLGNELFSLQGHWFWFTMNEHAAPYTFPKRQGNDKFFKHNSNSQANASIFKKLLILLRKQILHLKP